jgi:hypothetical protein
MVAAVVDCLCRISNVISEGFWMVTVHAGVFLLVKIVEYDDDL